MANPLPFATTSNDTVDWVKAVTPVTVSGGGTVVQSGLQPNSSGSLSFSLSTSTSNVGFGWNDGLAHTVCGVTMAMTMTAFSGTPPWVGNLFVETGPPKQVIGSLNIGIESFPASGLLATEQLTFLYPNGFFTPQQSLGTFGVNYNFNVLTGSGSFTLWATITVVFI